MTSRPLTAILQQLRAVGERDGAGSTDGELLTRFLSQRDDAALAALVERHAPMVWGVCRRVLRNPHDAEDAFQATFLVLVRKAGTVMSRELLANWLYGVAHQTAVRLKATAAKRGVREMQLKDMPEPAAAEARVSDLLPLLDQELSRLPEHHRVLIVLCDLEGKTRKEAARQLGCPEGTVASRLARARDMLAKRMARHGMAVSGGSLAAVFSQSSASAGVPNSVVSSTIHVATLLAANQAVGVISGSVAALTEGVLKTMLLKKIMTTTMVVLALSVAVITGGSLAVGQTEGTGNPVAVKEVKQPAAEKPVEPALKQEKEAFTAWGKEVGGLQAGLGFKAGEKRAYTHGETVTLVVRVRNVEKEAVEFNHIWAYFVENPPTVTDGDGKPVQLPKPLAEGMHLPRSPSIAPGKEVDLYDWDVKFLPKGDNSKGNRVIRGTGKFSVQYERIVGPTSANPQDPNLTMSKLATGKLELEVKEPEKQPPEKEPFTAWGKEVGGLQAGLGFKAGEKRAYSHGETVTLVVRVRNVQKNGLAARQLNVKDNYIPAFFFNWPPTVTDGEGKAVTPIRVAGKGGDVNQKELILEPWKEVEVAEVKLELRPESESGNKSLNTLYGTGKFQIHYKQLMYSSGKHAISSILHSLATGKLELEVNEPEKLPPGKETPTVQSNAAAAPAKPKPNYVTVVGQLLDDATGQPIEKAVWEFGMASLEKPAEIAWGHSWSTGGSHPGGKFEQLVHFTPDGRFDRLRVYAAGYETADVVLELPNPRPLQVERTVRLKRGRTVTGVLRDHAGKPVANGWVFFIPKGHRSNIVEGFTGSDVHQLTKESRDAAVAEVRTNENGTFFLPVTVGGTLAASTDLVDLWPFALPEDGHADLKMPAPSYLVIDLTYWYLDELAKKGKRALSPDSEDPNQCWVQVYRNGSGEPLWKNLEYRRQLLAFAKDPRAKLSKGVIVGHVVEGEWDKPIPGVGHNKNLSTKVRIALPPGSYRVQRLRAGPFAPVDEKNVVLKPGEETTMHWARGDGSSVRGKGTWPANMQFVRQPGEKPRKLDWTVPNTATVRITPVGADDKASEPIEAAKIQPDGSFFIATNLDPGKYKVTARVTLPMSDGSQRRSGWRGPDCEFSQEFTVPDPARGPFGSPPVEVEIKMNVGAGGRFVATDPPAAPAKPANTVEPPAEKEKEPFTAWGKEVGGLQAGLGFKASEKRAYTLGETVTLVVRVRNVGKEEVKFSYFPDEFYENPPVVTDDGGKPVPLEGAGLDGVPRRMEVNLTPGKEVELSEIGLALLPASERSKQKPVWKLFGTGKFELQCERIAGNFQDKIIGGPDPMLSKLATGKLELEVKEAPAPALALPGVPTGLAPAEKQKVLTPEEAIKIAGDSKLAKEFNENKPPVEFKVEFVTKATLVKTGGEKDAGWVHGHSPDDVCLGTLVPVSPIKADDPLSKNQTRFVATLTAKAISQLNMAGINDMEKHFKGKTVRVTGTISRRVYGGIGDHSEIEIVIDDLNQIEAVK